MKKAEVIPAGEAGKGCNVVESKPTFYQFDVHLLNLSPEAAKEETLLRGHSKYETRKILRKLSDQVRWRKLCRVVVAGSAYYYPVEDAL